MVKLRLEKITTVQSKSETTEECNAEIRFGKDMQPVVFVHQMKS